MRRHPERKILGVEYDVLPERNIKVSACCCPNDYAARPIRIRFCRRVQPGILPLLRRIVDRRRIFYHLDFACCIAPTVALLVAVSTGAVLAALFFERFQKRLPLDTIIHLHPP